MRCGVLCEIIWCVTLPQVMWENIRKDSQSCGTVMNTVISVMLYVCSGRDAAGSSSLLLPVTLNQQLSVAPHESLWGNNAKCLKVPCVLSQNLTATGVNHRIYTDIAYYLPKLVSAVPGWFVAFSGNVSSSAFFLNHNLNSHIHSQAWSPYYVLSQPNGASIKRCKTNGKKIYIWKIIYSMCLCTRSFIIYGKEKLYSPSCSLMHSSVSLGQL